jgi:hypothetical protein
MSTPDLRASLIDATVSTMFDPIPILMARDRVRVGIEGPARERRPARIRPHAATLLRRLADRVDGGGGMRHRPATR